MKADHQNAGFQLRGTAIILWVLSLLCSPWLIGKFGSCEPLSAAAVETVLTIRARLFLAGLSVILLAELIAPARISRSLGRLFDKSIATKLLTSCLAIGLTLTVATVGIPPFLMFSLQTMQTIFVKHQDLGWSLRPASTVSWGGVEVKINERGLRGPLIPYPRDESKPRILYLGDSVTFGYMLPEYHESYPFVIERLLEGEFHRGFETVNAGVGGYSPWQHLIFLEQEGVKYEPDIIVLGFVLNDVVEKFQLTRYGGNIGGRHLERAYHPWRDWFESNSALKVLLSRFWKTEQVLPEAHQDAVEREISVVEDLAKRSESSEIREAWALTRKSLEGLVTLCRERGVPIVVVIFPFTFQFDDPAGLSAPQKELQSFCDTHDVPFLDLLPLMGDYLKKEGKTPDALFLDADHMSVLGCQVTGEMVVSWMRSQPALWSKLQYPLPPASSD